MAGPPGPGPPSSAVDGPFASSPPSTISALLASLSSATVASASSVASEESKTIQNTAAATTTAPSTHATTTAPSTLSTSTTGSPSSHDSSTSPPPITSPASSTIAAASTNLSFPPSGQPTDASANPASTTGIPATITKQQACRGMSCNPGLQVAVAVPVILVTLGAIAIFFLLCARRRRRLRIDSPEPEPEPEGVTGSRPESRRRGGGWARHLRIFSFDAELLIGGRSSASTSVRDGATSQLDHRSVRSVQPSVRSLQSAAPAYRDALSSAQPPIMVAPMTQIQRPESQATAPPSYYGGATAGSRPQTAQTDHTQRSDPFADPDPEDDEPVSPVEGPLLSRNSGQYHDARGDDTFSTESTPVASREPSIREAQVARRVSARGAAVKEAGGTK